MFKLHPIPDVSHTCPYCDLKLDVKGWYIPGMPSWINDERKQKIDDPVEKKWCALHSRSNAGDPRCIHDIWKIDGGRGHKESGRS